MVEKVLFKGAVYKTAKQEIDPQEYHREHDRCPRGFHWEGKKCLPFDDSESKKKPEGKKQKTKKVEVTPKTHPRLFTKSGRRLFIQPNPKAKLELNAEYDEKEDNTYYAKSIIVKDGVTKIIRHYTKDFVIRNKRKKFAKNQLLAKKMPAIRASYTKDLNSENLGKRYRALAVAMVDQGLFRVGNETSEKHGVLGLHNLKVENMKLDNEGVSFEYKGKHGVIQRHVLTDKKIRGMLKDLVKGKKKGDSIFSWEDGGKKESLTPEKINDYFRGIGSPSSIHKLRSYHASKMAFEALEQDPPDDVKDDPRKMLEYFKDKILPISKRLGHTTIGVTLNHYIDPTIYENFFKRNKQKVPRTILASTSLEEKLRVSAKPKKASPGEKKFRTWMNTHIIPNHPPKLIHIEKKDK